MAKIPVQTILAQVSNDLHQQLARQATALNKGVGSAQNSWNRPANPAPSTPKGPQSSGNPPASQTPFHSMEPVPLQAEPLVPQDLTPQSLKPSNEIPEGESAFDSEPTVAPKPVESATLRYLTHICNQGLSGAMITNEILEAPLAMRQGYLSRYRRRAR